MKNLKRDSSPHIPQRDKLKDRIEIKERHKLSEKQQKILAVGLDKNTKCLILDGVAGTARTWISVLIALKLLEQKRIGEISYIRSLVQSKDGETGFLSGSLEEKTFYFNVPLFDKLQEFLSKPEIDKLIKEERIKTLPTSMLRGCQLSNSVAILDECQCCLLSSIETVMTRMGEFSLLILCGDNSGSQNDLGAKSGFKKLCEIFNDEESKNNGIHYFKLDSSDIVRSKFVKYVVEKFEKVRPLLNNGNGNGHH